MREKCVSVCAVKKRGRFSYISKAANYELNSFDVIFQLLYYGMDPHDARDVPRDEGQSIRIHTNTHTHSHVHTHLLRSLRVLFSISFAFENVAAAVNDVAI